MKKKWLSLILAGMLVIGMGQAVSANMGGLAPAGLDPKYLPYSYVGGLNEGLAYYCNLGEDDLCGFIDTDGNVVIEAQFNDLAPFREGLAPVSKNGKWGYIDQEGHIVVPIIYDGVAYEFSEGLAIVMIDGLWGYVDKAGEEVIPLIYEETQYFSEGLAAVQVDGKYGFINKSGEMVIEPQFDYAFPFGDGLAPVLNGDVWGFIDKSGNVVVPYQYDSASRLNEGLAVVAKDGLWGYINAEGEEVIAPQFELASYFNEGLAPVMLDGAWGFIDKTGKTVIEPQYLAVKPFSEGLAVVFTDYESAGFIDVTGNAVTEFHYMDVDPFTDGVALATDGGIYSFYFISHPLQAAETNGADDVNGTGDAAATVPAAPEKAEAKPSSAAILVDGQKIAFEAYNIQGNNYFKLRDLASALNGSDKQFEVTWDASANAIQIISGQSYTAVGGEFTISGGTGVKTAQRSSSSIYLDGKAVQWTAYHIGGNNYFKLRDIGQALDFYVGWDAAANTVIIDTTKGYSE